jgi:hypothetical protein
MSSTIPQNAELLKNFFDLLSEYRPLLKQKRTFLRLVQLVLGEIFVFARHTISQIIMALGQNEGDWTAWYRLFSHERFPYKAFRDLLLRQVLRKYEKGDLFVVAGDSTQTPRSSRKMEGSGWLRNLRTPPFMVGIHAAQRWFHGAVLLPEERSYSRALPLFWQAAFTEKSQPKAHEPCKEWEAALQFLNWLKAQFAQLGREQQPLLMVADGAYDHLKLWQNLPAGVVLLARSAKNRVLYHLPSTESKPGRGRKRLYAERAKSPQELWREKKGWRKVEIKVRGKLRHLQYRLQAPVLRKEAAHTPLVLIIVRGKSNARTRREPLPFLVNAIQNDVGAWVLPLPIETLLFWAWQRWEIEVAHRELKSNFGLGEKQCWHPKAAVLSVQWSAWLYALLLLAGYRTWGLASPSPVPSRWWRGAPRWSLNTLWRAYRACLWGEHEFRPLDSLTRGDWLEITDFWQALGNSIFAAARS